MERNDQYWHCSIDAASQCPKVYLGWMLGRINNRKSSLSILRLNYDALEINWLDPAAALRHVTAQPQSRLLLSGLIPTILAVNGLVRVRGPLTFQVRLLQSICPIQISNDHWLSCAVWRRHERNESSYHSFGSISGRRTIKHAKYIVHNSEGRKINSIH